jgi:hypothetical protein
VTELARNITFMQWSNTELQVKNGNRNQKAQLGTKERYA